MSEQRIDPLREAYVKTIPQAQISDLPELGRPGISTPIRRYHEGPKTRLESVRPLGVKELNLTRLYSDLFDYG